MAWKCDVCGDSIHLKKIGNKNYPIRCPLEKFRNVKGFYTPELRQMLSQVFFDEFTLSNNPKDLKSFSEMIPDETPISRYVKKIQDVQSKEHHAYTKTLILQGSLDTFFVHFTRVLMEIFDDNKIHYLDSPQHVGKEQFSYLWLSPTTLRDCYFGACPKDARIKSMSQLGTPSLVIYPLGNVSSVPNKAVGDILLDVLTHRQSLGKPTWILKSKDFNKCQEITSSEELRTFLSRSSNIPTVVLDEDEDILIDRPTSGKKGNDSTGSNGNYF